MQFFFPIIVAPSIWKVDSIFDNKVRLKRNKQNISRDLKPLKLVTTNNAQHRSITFHKIVGEH